MFITHNIGSHLVEVAVRFSSDRTFAAIFDAVMAGIDSYCLDRAANFVVQSLLQHLRTDEQRVQAIAALRPLLTPLFEKVLARPACRALCSLPRQSPPHPRVVCCVVPCAPWL
jgi:hypothetical protein